MEEKLKKLWLQNVKTDKIAKRLGVSASKVYSMAKSLGLEKRDFFVDPTPQELEERAAEIRKNWSRAERESRLVGGKFRPESWTPPLVKLRA